MPNSPQRPERPVGSADGSSAKRPPGRLKVLGLVVGVLVVVLVGSAALVWRDATGHSRVSLTDAKPDQPTPTASPTSAPSTVSTPSAQQAALQQAVKGREGALKKLAGTAQLRSKKLRAAAAKAAYDAANPSATFVFAQFNVQGSSHRGNVAQRSRHAVTLLDNAGATVAALQEFAPANRRAFFGAANGRWSEATTGVRSYEADNALLWRADTWSLVRAETRSYPYFGGAERRMPRVLLKNKATGAQVWFASYHNPASCCGHEGSAKYRSIAVNRQAADANALRAQGGTPLVVSGDMNDRQAYFCKMSAAARMHSADGGTNDGGCRPPPRPWIDWVMGTADVAFSGYTRNDDGFVDAASDHPFISTTVHVGP